MAKIAWILGAGFSYPVGGPLLSDLFTPLSWELTEGRFGGRQEYSVITPDSRAAHWLYNYGRKFPQGVLRSWQKWTPPGEILWAHAEEFLARLDTVSGPDGAPFERRALEFLNHQNPGASLQSPTIAGLTDAAQRLLAAECSGFVTALKKDDERCLPYRRWVAELVRPEDLVVTFNYDVLVEQLTKWFGGPIVQVAPSSAVRDSQSCPLIKLHGSLDWRCDPGTSEVTCQQDNEFALKRICTSNELAIACPGQNKIARSKNLERLWTFAMAELADADVVVVLGYRMPQMDAFARKSVFGALKVSGAEHLGVHVVLGPSAPGDPLTTRLMELLARAMRPRRHRPEEQAKGRDTYRIKLHTLGAEDYLQTWSREDILSRAET